MWSLQLKLPFLFFSECGGTFTKSSEDILSPGYPELYSNKLNCTYQIGKSGDYISLTFDEPFSVEGKKIHAMPS